MCSSSFRLSSGSVTMLLHLSSSVFMIPSFWCSGWCEVKFRYWSVESRSLIVPSSFRTINVSRNGSDPSLSSSYAYLILPVVLMVFRCALNCCSHPFFTIFVTSSMYRFHSRGWHVTGTVALACCSSHSINRLAITGVSPVIWWVRWVTSLFFQATSLKIC